MTLSVCYRASIGAALAVLREASVSNESLEGLGRLSVLATAACVEWPKTDPESEPQALSH
jgi:hypothetical protein